MTETIETIRARLKKLYDEFVKKFGMMNKQKNRKIIMLDSYGFKVLSSVETKTGSNEYREADVLTKSQKVSTEPYKNSNVHDALGYVLGMTGRVDMKMLTEITDENEDEILLALGDKLYLDPVSGEWQTSDKYLSGNVYRKLCEAESVYRDNPSEQVLRSLNAIKEIQPDKIPFTLLSEHLNLGERWIPNHIYKRFAMWLFEVNVTIHYVPSTDTYKTDVGYGAKPNREYYVGSKGRTRLYGGDLLEYALMNVNPHIEYGNPAQPDNDAIQLANSKIEDIRTKFTQWINVLEEDDKQMLVDMYNNLYNCYVLRKYDGSHLTFPGLDLSRLGKDETPINLYSSQRDNAWRIIQDCGAIIDNSVGTGKTIIMILASYEMKRMKIRNKPCILALKANVGDIVKTYRLAYPHAKILAPGENDFKKENRTRLFHEIKNNDWDCVIMTHDQFGRIPQSSEVQKEILEDEISNLERDLDSLSDAGYNISRSMRKGLENRKAGLMAKLKIVQNRIEKGKDRDIEFDEMYIDHLLCDEAHKFKNLTFTTRHDKVAGLGNQEGSQKALNMLFAIRTLQKRFNSDLQATFLSGTPISNSLTEMYLLFKYLRPKELARQNILNFDAWAAVFAKKTTDFEFSVTNQIIAKERFRHFIKVPELALFYNEIADYRTNKSIGIDLPEMEEELVNLKPSEEQQEYTQKLIMYAKTGNGSWIDRYDITPAMDRARMLIATNYAKKMSTDMRLINSELYDDHPGNKISVCCEKVVEFYRKHYDDKGTQLIFCDLGVPDDHKWNVYQAILDKLVQEYLIPEAEIAFIHDYNERTRTKLFQQVNDGVVRILIGSTDKAGTGVNVQQRVVAIHDLDIPWKPAELEQRGGRGARQGNWLAKLKQDNRVFRYIYATEKSLDTYKFTLLKNKQTFIAQMKTNELQVRAIDEGSFDEGTGMNFAEYVAILSGDTSLLEKAKIDKKLAVLENLRTVHYREIHNNKYLLEHKTSRLEEVTEIAETLERDNIQYSTQLTRDDTGTRDNPIVIYALTDIRKELQEKRDIQDAERARIKAEKKAKREEEKAQVAWKKLNAKATKRAIQEGYPVEDDVTEDIQEVPDEVEGEELVPLKDQIQDDAVLVGEWLVKTWQSWKPKVGETNECIGELYGFNLYIERVTTSDTEVLMSRSYAGSNQVVFTNHLYAQHPNGGLKYKYNHGVPVRANERLASRIFLNSLERIYNLLTQYTDEKQRLIQDVRHLSQMDEKPFGREEEIRQLKADSVRLEREISDKISGINTVVEVM